MSFRRRVYVQPGEVFWSERPCLFKTVLGSCVSVCLWDPVLGLGGLNHFMLPRSRTAENDARYGEVAILRLIEGVRGLGGRSLVAKIFGGAAVSSGRGGGGDAPTVGSANTDIAVSVLGAHKIPLVAQRTGGTAGIVIEYCTDSGEVRLREIPAVAVPDPVRRAGARRPVGRLP